MEQDKTYTLGRYRIVEQIEKVEDGFQWQVTAYDDETAREFPWASHGVIRFDARRVARTIAGAQRELGIAVAIMKKSVTGDMP